ncbi:hypothetical protein [Paraburkholderia unamae]|uniref:hypothetical protein n=1 Tax=Paraburkholderia unamae TaxID=219649 RepID=UPI00319E413E
MLVYIFNHRYDDFRPDALQQQDARRYPQQQKENALNDIVKSLSIENMLRQRDAVIERLSAAKRLIDEADEIGARAGLGAVSGHIGDKYAHSRCGAPRFCRNNAVK